ncbi:hypothetical protein Dsin_013157 [Dipteronia sinensis]|uniref:R13L1/DRL21-like LRR repeat region domain-containing protein n=1 Tax=Dipteronia sinensis TaxID=43782 RepID=A0AAE0E959_9ROSI|nr:hypothetical protein Dsin_013157 [Dipteronia sinensis]
MKNSFLLFFSKFSLASLFQYPLYFNIELEELENTVDEAKVKKAQLMNKENLVRLLLNFYGGIDISLMKECRKDSVILEALQPPRNLESLFISCYRSITLFPHWMVLLTQLKSLALHLCIKFEYFPPLGKLSQLESLGLTGEMETMKVMLDFSSYSQVNIMCTKQDSTDVKLTGDVGNVWQLDMVFKRDLKTKKN